MVVLSTHDAPAIQMCVIKQGGFSHSCENKSCSVAFKCPCDSPVPIGLMFDKRFVAFEMGRRSGTMNRITCFEKMMDDIIVLISFMKHVQ